jgi:hypothetical protein
MNVRRVLCPGLGLALFTAVACAAPVRTALVIGNERYETAIGSLRNSANDAKAMARTLRGLGFTVTEKHDLTRDQLLRAVDAFRRTLTSAEVGLFYYAGHGVSVDGSNYLVPIKSGFAPGEADETTLRMLAETHLFNVEQAVADMATAGAKCNLVILDACRTPQLAGASRSRGFESRGGLVEMTPPAGSLIAFATDSGRAAYDGDGANGLYTEELIKNLACPGLTIEQVFKRTRAGVLKRSDGGQMPAEYSRLVGDDVYLAGDMPVAAALPVPLAERTESDLLADATKFAAHGEAKPCVDALEAMAQKKGPGDYAFAPLNTLLDQAKEALRNATGPSAKVAAALDTCERIVHAGPVTLPPNDSRTAELLARAQNRRGDALFLLARTAQALAAYEAAFTLAPSDAYIRYNRGRAHLALGDKASARADFTAASAPAVAQPGARKLAAKALSSME